MTATAWLRASAFVWLGAIAAGAASAEPVTRLQRTGDPANRVDMVVLGDGYTDAEMGKFAADVNTFMAAVFAQQPWAEYRPLFNIARVDVASPQSGASHPERGSLRTTAFNASYNCAGIQRLICVDLGAVNAAVARSLGAAEHDLLFVLVNDAEYGGSGGGVSVASTNIAAVEIVLHELGHTLGQLGDEYVEFPPRCIPGYEPPNATSQTSRASIKWSAWIDPSTPLPTTTPTAGVPGLYLGAVYCPSGIYRPTDNSKMRALGFPYEQINTEQLIKQVYNVVRPVDAFSPPLGAVSIPAGGATPFSVTVPRLATHSPSVSWVFDGNVVASGPSLTAPASAVPPGTHTLQAIIRDDTPAVRVDPSGLLQSTLTWTISGASPPAPPTTLNGFTAGSVVTLSWTRPSAGSTPTDYVVEAGSAPGLSNLALFHTGNDATIYTATNVGSGVYYVRVRSSNSAGTSAPTPDLVVTVGGPCGGSPFLTSQVSGTTVTLTWTPSPGAVSYAIEAGSSPGRTDIVAIDTGNGQTTFVATGVGSGFYFVRVRATSVCGTSPASNEQLVVVP
jgi:hypothetical protein